MDSQDVSEPSPLKRFRSAKADMQLLFNEMLVTLENLVTFLSSHSEGGSKGSMQWIEKNSGSESVVKELTLRNELKLAQEVSERTRSIVDTVERDTMKAVFFGRTSNGKSTLINAMLSSKLLPVGFGHTTNCFCRIRGADIDTGYVVGSTTDCKMPIKDLKQLAHALYTTGPDCTHTADVFWPRNKCRLLQDYVEILDSPGLDISEDYDLWIDEHCKDADILVLVANAESTLNLTETKFITQVHRKLVNPSIFICFNRWDCIDGAADDTDEAEGVKRQHLDSAFNLLVGQLGLSGEVNGDGNVQDRIFLLSAKEAIAARTGDTRSSQLSEGQLLRYNDFERFEKNFEECMSLTAIEKRFESHTKSGVQIARDISRSLGALCHRVEACRSEMSAMVEEEERQREQLLLRSQQYKKRMADYLQKHIDEVEPRLVELMHTEGRAAISRAVNQYVDCANLFRKDDLSAYGSALKSHLISAARTSLVHICSEELTKEFSIAQTTSLDLVGSDDKTSVLPYPGTISINCDSFVERFSPDIAFRFSFGALGSIAMSKCQSLKKEVLQRLIFASPSSVSHTSTNEFTEMALDFAQSPAGAIALAGIAYSTPVRRILHYGVIAFGAMYIFQYTTYTKSKQMANYKRQLVDHTVSRLSDASPQIAYYLVQDLRSRILGHTEAIYSKMEIKDASLQDEICDNQRIVSVLTDFSSQVDQICQSSREHERKFRSFEDRYLGHQKIPQIASPFRVRAKPPMVTPTPNL